MSERVIDLRFRPSSCTSHPVIALASELSKLPPGEAFAVRLLFSAEDIPVEVAKLYLAKHGFSVKQAKELGGGHVEVLAERASRGA